MALTDSLTPTPLPTGIVALHSNRTEALMETAGAWLQAHPLGVLEEETILVQSNGMAEWVKMQLAQQLGVCAATRVTLPARFMWRVYRQVMGVQRVQERSPLDKAALVWRLMRELPALAQHEAFKPLAAAMAGGDAQALYQVSTRLAALLDQYQVYRADWLMDWQQGGDGLRRISGERVPLPDDQLWQAQVWRHLMGTLSDEQQAAVRPVLHTQVLERLNAGGVLAGEAYSGLPRRVVVFGMSHLPLPVLQLLGALSRHSQVILALPNPCRFHWADTLDGRQWHSQIARRQHLKNGVDVASVPLEQLHAYGHPLLGAWGKQGRDFLRLWDGFEEDLAAKAGVQVQRVELFTEDESPNAPLLEQVQNSIRDLVPLTEMAGCEVPAWDRSIMFHAAHSPLREVEVLQDQLLHLLGQEAQLQTQLQPKDIVVMVPNIDTYAPAIRAVMGQYARSDPRYIPFEIADLSARQSHPLVEAVQWLLRWPHARCTLDELRTLLECPGVATRFGIEPEQMDRVMGWCEGAQARWGLDGAHRQLLGLEACGETHTLLFALRRMMMGYASGDYHVDEAKLQQQAQLHPQPHPEPYPEIGGLDAQCLGGLSDLVEQLQDWMALSVTVATPLEWGRRLRALLGRLFAPQSLDDKQLLLALGEALTQWLHACDVADFDAAVPLSVAGDAWLAGLDEPTLAQRFKGSGVTFCNLMPMRAIPFEVVCVLGMNDGDFPRTSPRSDWDLMALPGQFRPGDRSRQDDDRQLLLEALLSARRVFYVSWVGKNVRDNSELPPSVLVAQLRDYLAAGWSQATVDALTTHHPLQPFSRRYFEEGSALVSYAREWRMAHIEQEALGQNESGGSGDECNETLSQSTPEPTLEPTPDALANFFKHPVRAYFKAHLGVVFEEGPTSLAVDEPFDLAGLDHFAVAQKVLDRVLTPTADGSYLPSAGPDLRARLRGELARCQREGDMPLGAPGQQVADELENRLWPMLQAYCAVIDVREISQVRESLEAEQSAHAIQPVPCVPSRWMEKGSADKPRLSAFLKPWLHSLFEAGQGRGFDWVSVGLDGTVHASAWPPERAQAQWQSLVTIWQQGLQAPLPLPIRTASAQLLATNKVVSTYEGSYTEGGEVQDVAWARVYPGFAQLSASGQFADLTQAVYAPLKEWISTCTQFTPHPQTDALDAIDALDAELPGAA